MQITKPTFYKEFSCIAGACPDTCCAGWQIVVDEKALRKYKAEKGDFRKRLRKGVNWKQKTFRQDKEKRCAFLNEENLCDMYKALGAKSLCKTCRLYPRHIEEFENTREITLSISCPEVARILMDRMEPVKFLTVEKEGEEQLVRNLSRKTYDILKVAHHGSQYSTTQDFLEVIKPRIALISAGKNNSYGHPHAETLSRLKKCHCKVFETTEYGAIMVETDGDLIDIFPSSI